jgi:hypothetical protein
MLEDLAAFAERLATVERTQRAGETLFSIYGALENSWRTSRKIACEDIGIPLPPPRAKGMHPVACEVVEAELRFAFSLGEEIESSKVPARADFQVRVTGVADYRHCVVELEDHWRVDTHDFVGEPHEPHPRFHFQRGGHSQDYFAGSLNFVPGPALPERLDDYWRSLLQSPGPRIPFPPLCPILAIDFVISQHDGNVWRRLRNVPEYLEIIARAQERLWTPFFESLAEATFRRRWLGPVHL